MSVRKIKVKLGIKADTTSELNSLGTYITVPWITHEHVRKILSHVKTLPSMTCYDESCFPILFQAYPFHTLCRSIVQISAKNILIHKSLLKQLH